MAGMTKKKADETGGKATTKGADAARGAKFGADKIGADKKATGKYAPVDTTRRKSSAKPAGVQTTSLKPKAIKAPAYKATDHPDPQAEREANRYDNPILSREGLIQFLTERSELMSAETIAEALGYRDIYRQEALTKRLTAMVRDGQLLVNRRGGYGLAQKLDLIAGTVIANPDGFGFLRSDEGGEDLFLSPKEMRAVMHGDRVLANVTGIDRRGRSEGAIVEVLQRRRPRLVGRFDQRGGLGLVIPDDRRLHQDVMIPPGQQGEARPGQIVVAEITEAPSRESPPIGRVVAVLGEKLEASLIVRVAIESHGLPHDWPIEVTREAEAVEPEVSAEERAGREDIRALPLVTIDGEDARDFDDAVYCVKTKTGYRLLVAIADVSHYVKPGTKLDAEAYERATSVYFPGFVVPMLPETLSNGICSLNPKVERLCMVCDMQIDKHGEVQDSRFYPAVMRSHARLTYTRVWRALGERDADERAAMGDLLPQLETLHELYKLMAKSRVARGAIDFDSKEVKFRLGAAGEVLALQPEARNDAHKLIEECMIAANVEAALFLAKSKVPAPYRVHAPPPESKFAELQEFLAEFSLRLPPHDQVLPADYAKLIRKVRERPEAMLLESVLLRSQALAVYLPECEGHFGLSLPAYAHFTSPIRRYPDLLVHRAIRHVLSGGKPATYIYGAHDMQARCTHCSERGRRADEAEREVDERYQCAWMSKHVGSEFDGIVSGVTAFGLFVQIADTGVSGLIHVTQLPNDYYHFDSGRREMVGERRGLRFRLGDALRVQVLRASMEERKVDLRLAGGREVEPKPMPEKPARKKR
jgi:ribonuclease R